MPTKIEISGEKFQKDIQFLKDRVHTELRVVEGCWKDYDEPEIILHLVSLGKRKLKADDVAYVNKVNKQLREEAVMAYHDLLQQIDGFATPSNLWKFDDKRALIKEKYYKDIENRNVFIDKAYERGEGL